MATPLASTLAPAPLLRAWRYFESHDLDETRERITRVLAPHHLLPQGVAQDGVSRMSFVRMAGLGFGALRYGGAMGVRVPEMAGYHLLILCPRGSGVVRLRGGDEIRLDERHGFACAPGQSFEASFSADCEQFFVRLDRAALARHHGEGTLALAPQIDLARPALAPALGLLRLLMQEEGLAELARDQPRIGAEYEQLLISLLLAGLPRRAVEAPPARGAAPAMVVRAERFIHAHATEELDLQRIATAAGVPVRTLLEGFARFRETSPIRYLRQVRLDMAREKLRCGEGGSVAEVAAACGFGHPGRFSQEYRARFGEMPSQTRRV
ncbi:AraC family transcriptional regulator [Roseomonas sp. GC11]|uniref:AraC family transcriptional regulator n=1 Tax=Roseomonas sp. GC11 TaxID=2950546 RepID=UPI00210C7FDB|nr:AraC family transcriptional regulator [Roseomonas sp. GC11]MCQ4159107.1 AraC family transcriptional regulator [Roseomonas sp. GC11]